MPTKSNRFQPQVRIWSLSQIATRLGRSESWMRRNLTELEKAGLPKEDPLLKGRDSIAFEKWLDGRSGLSNEIKGSNEDILRTRARAIANGRT